MTGLEAAADAATLVTPQEAAAQAERARAEGAAEARRQMAEAERSAVTATAAATQSRIKSILGSPAAIGREALAQRLAFETTIPADDAVALLEAAPAAAAARVSRINAPAPRIDAGVETEGSSDPFAPRALGRASPSMTRRLSQQNQKPLELIPGTYWMPEFSRGA
jgi:hypothetical protein